MDMIKDILKSAESGDDVETEPLKTGLIEALADVRL